jgi:hypothetical protein
MNLTYGNELFLQLQCDASFFTVSLRCGVSCSVLLQYKIFGCRNNEVKWTRRIQSDNMCIKPLITRVYIYIYIFYIYIYILTCPHKKEMRFELVIFDSLGMVLTDRVIF